MALGLFWLASVALPSHFFRCPANAPRPHKVPQITERSWDDVRADAAKLSMLRNWPVDVMWALVRRRSQNLAAENKLKEMMDVLSPWSSKAESLFNPEEPRLRDFPMEFPERFARFESHFIDNLLIGAMHKEADGARDASLLAREGAECLMAALKQGEDDEDNDDDDDAENEGCRAGNTVPEDMQSQVEAFLLVCRCVSFLTNPEPGQFGEKMSHVTQFESKIPKDLPHVAPERRMAIALRAPYWAAKVAELVRYEKGEEMAEPDLATARDILRSDNPSPSMLKTVANCVLASRQLVRPVVAQKLCGDLAAGLRRLESSLTFTLTTMDGAKAQAAYLRECLDVCSVATTINDDLARVCTCALQQVNRALEQVNFGCTKTDLLAAVQNWVETGGATVLAEGVQNARRENFRFTDGDEHEKKMVDVVSYKLGEWAKEDKGKAFSDMNVWLHIFRDIGEICPAMKVEEPHLAAKLDTWRLWGDLVSKTRPLIDPTKPFAERKSNITEWTRSIERIRVSMPTVAEDKDKWNAVVEGFEKDLSEMAETDRASAKATVDEIADKLRLQTAGLIDGKWHSNCAPSADFEALKKHAGKTGNLLSLDAKELDRDLSALFRAKTFCVEVHSFYATELGQEYTEGMDSFMKQVCVLYTSGCLLGGLDKTTSELEARKIALKQLKRMKNST